MDRLVAHSPSPLQALQTNLDLADLPESVSLFASSENPTTFLGCADKKTLESCCESIENIVRTHFSKESSIKWVNISSEAPTLPIRHVHLAGPKEPYNKWILSLVKKIQELDDGREIDLSTMTATKVSLLTSIENVLDHCIIRAIQSGTYWPKEYAWFLKNLPQAVPELIGFMYAERVLNHLSREEVEDLKSTYQLCLAGEEAAELKTYAILKNLISSPMDDE